jgi:hypothetical protein
MFVLICYICHSCVNLFIFIYINFCIETEVKFDGNRSWIENILYDTKPVMILGDELSQLRLNYLGNYVPNQWTPTGGCTACSNKFFSLEDKADFELPEVLVAVFSIHPSPFFRRFLKRVTELNYPKSRISLRLYILVCPSVWCTGITLICANFLVP